MKPKTARRSVFSLLSQTTVNVAYSGPVAERTGKAFEGLRALANYNNLVVLRNLCLHLKPKRTGELG
jgi:hypothetical protein